MAMAEHKTGTFEEWKAAREELAKLENEHAQRKRGDQESTSMPWATSRSRSS